MKTHLLAAAAFVLATGVAVPVSPAQAQEHRSQHQECRDVETKQINSSDDHRIAGTAIGAAAGGLLGHTVGHGGGKTAATVGGAVVGGVVGNQVQKSNQNKNATYETHRECHWVND